MEDILGKTPRQRRKEKNREAILDTAFQSISEEGVENFSLREVASEADYSPAALYKYFDGKQGILEALLVRENLKLIERLNEISDEIDLFHQLIDMCMIYIQFNLENRAYLYLVNSMISPRRTKEQAIPKNSPYSVFLQTVSEWVSAEEIDLSTDYGLEEITYALWAQIHGMATLRLNQLKDFEADFDYANRRTIEIFLSGVKG